MGSDFVYLHSLAVAHHPFQTKVGEHEDDRSLTQIHHTRFTDYEIGPIQRPTRYRVDMDPHENHDLAVAYPEPLD